MKKLVLLTTLLASAYVYTVDEPVTGAVYAEIRGMSGGRIRIYKGASSTYPSIQNVVSKMWNPTVCFFDKQGNKLSQEEFANWRTLDKTSGEFSWRNYNSTIDGIRSRLAQAPEAHHAKMVPCIKTGRGIIELYDKNEMLIARTDFRRWDLNVEGSIPQDALDSLSKYVSNPEILSSLKITVVRQQITLKSLLF